MDQARFDELRQARQKAEYLESLVTQELQAERDEIQNLRKKLGERVAKRNELALALLDFGLTAVRVAEYAGIAPSYITELQKKR